MNEQDNSGQKPRLAGVDGVSDEVIRRRAEAQQKATLMQLRCDIATSCLNGLLASGWDETGQGTREAARVACEYADQLLAELHR